MAYLRLFHGRTDPDENLDDWGLNGPVFGPFPFVSVTYACEIRLGNESDGVLKIHGDVVHYDGVFYGDWCVFDGPPAGGEELTVEPFDPTLAVLPQREPLAVT